MEQLESIVDSVVQQFGLLTEEVALLNHGATRTLTVVIDRVSGTDQVDLDLLSEVTHAVSTALDEKWDDQAPYDLEVSSRGVSRPLEEPRHYERNLGRLVAITTTDGQKKEYRLRAVTTDGVSVQEQIPPAKKGMKAKLGDEQTIAFADIAKAKVQVEFSAAE